MTNGSHSQLKQEKGRREICSMQYSGTKARPLSTNLRLRLLMSMKRALLILILPIQNFSITLSLFYTGSVAWLSFYEFTIIACTFYVLIHSFAFLPLHLSVNFALNTGLSFYRHSSSTSYYCDKQAHANLPIVVKVDICWLDFFILSFLPSFASLNWVAGVNDSCCLCDCVCPTFNVKDVKFIVSSERLCRTWGAAVIPRTEHPV